jgi:hypothetical protein
MQNRRTFRSWYDEFLGGGHTPDYGHFPLVNALVDFVKALGEKYDGDNRIAFLHLGLLGFWYAQKVLATLPEEKFSTQFH